MAAVLSHVCLFSQDVPKLAQFYGTILDIEPVLYGDGYAELSTDGGVLSVFSVDEQNKLAPGSAQAGGNQGMILEFRVPDVDREYERVQEMGAPIVKGLTTQEWGNRSFYFRDPDGNLVNFYTRVQVPRAQDSGHD
jgi:catechol 2,3-dioxygenase-like lactoylglutathione lyase family enzyme